MTPEAVEISDSRNFCLNYTVGECNDEAGKVRGVVLYTLGRLLWPAGIPLLAAAACLTVFDLTPPDGVWWEMAPHICLGIGVLITGRFGFNRIAMTSSGLWGACLVIPHLAPTAYPTLAALTALLILVTAIVPEREMLSWSTAAHCVPIGAIGTLPWWPTGLRAQVDTALAYAISGYGPDWVMISAGVGVLFIMGFALLVYRAARSHSPVEGGLLVSALLWLGYVHTSGTEQSLLFLGLGVTVFLSAIEAGHSLAFIDELTGLPGRRALERVLRGLSGPYTLAMVDIDRFKKFNDKYGHDAGDEVLRMVAAQLRGVSGGGRAYRYGGEEFTVVFSGRTVEEVRDHLETLRADIADHPFVIRAPDRPKKKPRKPARKSGQGKVKVTISIGAAEPNERNADTASVLKDADKKLYQAKKKGRNRLAA